MMDASLRRALKSITDRCDAMIARAVQRVERRIGNVIAVAVIEHVNASTKFQTLKGTALEGDTDPDVVDFSPGGMWHVPLPGAEGLFLAIGGKGANRAAVGVSNRDARPTGGAPGESGLYTAGDNGGTKFYGRADGNVLIAPTEKTIHVGDLLVTGRIIAHCFDAAVEVGKHAHVSAVGPTAPPTPQPPEPPDDLEIP
jgi:phage baseplate assembly protein V